MNNGWYCNLKDMDDKVGNNSKYDTMVNNSFQQIRS